MNTVTAPRIVFPTIPADDPRFVWNPHGDVQAVWRRFGWVPPSELKQQLPDQASSKKDLLERSTEAA